MRIDPNKSKDYEILDQIKYHKKMRDFYSGNARSKKEQQKEINRLLKILRNRTWLKKKQKLHLHTLKH